MLHMESFMFRHPSFKESFAVSMEVSDLGTGWREKRCVSVLINTQSGCGHQKLHHLTVAVYNKASKAHII